jgi:uncharacterized MAPEG superfamily protein
MQFWILAGLGVFLINVYVPTLLYFPAEGLTRHLGPRDHLPEPGAMVLRARRSLANHQENLPFFLTLGILALIVDGADLGLAVLGAQMFVLSRIAYIALYVLGVPVVRSLAYVVGLVGCLIMAWALI